MLVTHCFLSISCARPNTHDSDKQRSSKRMSTLPACLCDVQHRKQPNAQLMQVLRGGVDAHVLMALAGTGSFILGLPLEGCLLFVLFHLAHALEAKFVRAAHTSISGLLDAVPAQANVVQADGHASAMWQSQAATNVADIAVGSLLAVRSGEAIPIDGQVVEGRALVGALQHCCNVKAARRHFAGELWPRLSMTYAPCMLLPCSTSVACAHAHVHGTAHGWQQLPMHYLLRNAAGQENVTGESLPVLKQQDSSVFSGGQVLDGALVVRTTAVAADSSAARIASITRAALQRHAPVEDFLSKLTRRWSEAVIAASAAALVALLAMGVPAWGPSGAVYRTLGLLTAAAPCALLLVSLSFVCAVAVLSRHGIIVKGAHVLDALRSISCVALDKTGTVSEGQLSCTGIAHVAGSRSGALEPLQAAAALSFRGSHPVCAAVLKRLAEEKASQRPRGRLRQGGSALQSVPAVDGFESQAGAGMAGHIDSSYVAFGSAAYVAPLLSGKQRSALDAAAERAGSNAVVSALVQTVAAPAQGNGTAPQAAQCVTLFVFSDTPRSDSRGVISSLRSMGLQVGIYTGDNKSSAHAMAHRIGVAEHEVFAGMTPGQKAGAIERLQSAGQRVLMVGDGINDAPALAQANAGVALAEDTASATAGVASVVLLHGSAVVAGGQPASILRIAFLLRVARAARRVVVQNLCIAFCSMLAGAAPVLSGVLPLWVAVLVHEGSTVLVALNSCRLLLMRQPQVQAELAVAQ